VACRACIALSFGLTILAASLGAASPGATSEPVGRRDPNRLVTPVNQTVTPLGIQVELPGLRPQTIALPPDGRLLAVSGKTSEVVVLGPASGVIRQRVTLPSDE